MVLYYHGVTSITVMIICLVPTRLMLIAWPRQTAKHFAPQIDKLLPIVLSIVRIDEVWSTKDKNELKEPVPSC
jgi:hypothetical protein